MVISSKGRYALRIMVYLAGKPEGEYVPLKEISEKENISQKYLESIATVLSKGHLIEAASGHKGGYHLSRKPEEYSIGEVLRMTEGSLAPVACLEDGADICERCDTCETLEVWQELYNAVNKVVDGVTIADLVERRKKRLENLDYSI